MLPDRTWIFAYGSLIARPGFDYTERQKARLHGYSRRFWQGSHDHRGTPEAPGRVVTLVPTNGDHCEGVAYRVQQQHVKHTLEVLDYREKNGYTRKSLPLEFESGHIETAIVYVADQGNFAYLGDAPMGKIAGQIRASHGPSGANVDYVLELEKALRTLDIHDPHVSELTALL